MGNSATACPLGSPGLEVATVARCRNHFTTWIVTAIIAARHAADRCCGSTPRELSAMPHNRLILMENPPRFGRSPAAPRDGAEARAAGVEGFAPAGAAPRHCESPQSHHAWSLGLRNGPSSGQEAKNARRSSRHTARAICTSAQKNIHATPVRYATFAPILH